MFKYISIVFQLLLLLFIVVIMVSSQKSSFNFNHYVIYLIIIATFLFDIWLTYKHNPKFYQKKIKYIIAPFIKSFFIFFVFSNILSFLFLHNEYQRELIFKISLLYPIIELAIYFIIILVSINIKQKKNEAAGQVVKKYEQSELKLKVSLIHVISTTKLKKLNNFKSNTLRKFFELKENIKEDIDTKIILFDKIDDKFQENSFELCLVDKKINNVKEINKLLSNVYNSLLAGGYALIIYEDLEDFEKRYFRKNGIGKIFKQIYYYLFLRLGRKIPKLNFFYYLFTNGKNQVISKAEMWGRLYYSGFEVEKVIKDNNLSYILVRKTKTPSENPSPSFSPVITLNRVSLYGNIVKIHKLRSMYPYSEFLQKKVFEEGNLTGIGKFANDFRITEFGKVFRKYWFDEIPQLLDWFRGEIKLVGIRAMSQHFFSLYNDEYKEAYYKVKPGIISPIFDEETDGFEDINRIEFEYLSSYLKNPIKTDFKYFFITIKQIFSGVRSR